MAIYNKPVKDLLRDMVEELGVKKGAVIHRSHIVAWFKEKYPKIKPGTISCHLIKMSTNAPSRIHYSVSQQGSDDLLFQIDAN